MVIFNAIIITFIDNINMSKEEKERDYVTLNVAYSAMSSHRGLRRFSLRVILYSRAISARTCAHMYAHVCGNFYAGYEKSTEYSLR